MKKKILHITIAIITVFTSVSCEDFLTQVNPNQVTTDNFWKDLDDCEAGMIAVYNAVRYQNLMQLTPEALRSDMAYPGYGRPSPNSKVQYYNQTFTDGDDAPNNKWAALYSGISRANQVIKGLNGIKSNMTSEENLEKWNSLMAEARLFRGLFHFWAHSSFNKGKVVIIDYVPVDESDFYQSAQSEDKVREFFRKDLEYAYENLPYLREDDYGDALAIDPQVAARATRGVAAMALAQSYLYQPIGADYEMAKVYLEDIITNGPYKLVQSDMNMTTKGEFNQESIFEISYDRELKPEEGSYSPPQSTYSNYAQAISPVGGWRSHLPSLWLIMAFREDQLDDTDSRNMVVGSDGFERLRTFSLRTSNSMALVDDLDSPWYGEAYPGNAKPFNAGETGYFRKLTNWDICTNEDTDLQVRSGVNYRLMRLADVYLLYAECLIQGGQGGDVETALNYVNKVRYRSALQLLGTGSLEYASSSFDGIDYDAQTLMETIMYKERPLELCLEGYSTRQLDLRRWGVTKQRFDYLATEVYHGERYDHPNSNGTGTTTHWTGVLRHGPHETNANSTYVDFTQASQNYIDEYHSYWPIPNGESTANPNI